MADRDIIRVFPRRTRGTPDDDMAFVGDPPLFRPVADEVHVSCTFTWDRPEAERLAQAWGQYYPTRLGGPAYGSPARQFVPGRYLKRGYVITSRGCPNHCGFCLVPQREGGLVILSIEDGFDVLDNNLLACPRHHIERVFAMLVRQPQRARFTGGFEALRVKQWHADMLAQMRIDTVFLAFDQDSPGRRDVFARAADILRPVCWPRRLCAYVLMGFAGDTVGRASRRLEFVRGLEVTPVPMWFRNTRTDTPPVPAEWRALLRAWRRPHAAWSPAPAASERSY